MTSTRSYRYDGCWLRLGAAARRSSHAVSTDDIGYQVRSLDRWRWKVGRGEMGYLIPSFGGLTISTLPWKFLCNTVWCLPTMKTDSHLIVELYTLSAKSCQALPASGSLTPYLSQKCLDSKIEDQPASGIFKEPLRKILDWPLWVQWESMISTQFQPVSKTSRWAVHTSHSCYESLAKDQTWKNFLRSFILCLCTFHSKTSSNHGWVGHLSCLGLVVAHQSCQVNLSTCSGRWFMLSFLPNIASWKL